MGVAGLYQPPPSSYNKIIMLKLRSGESVDKEVRQLQLPCFTSYGILTFNARDSLTVF
jgi:hypothetical protein